MFHSKNEINILRYKTTRLENNVCNRNVPYSIEFGEKGNKDSGKLHEF